MTMPLMPDVITTRSHRDGGLKVTEQVLSCSMPGCSGEMVAKVTKSLKPGDVILNMARRRGWHIEGDGRKVRICPQHEEPRVQKTKSAPQEPAMNNKTLMPLSESLKQPSDAARAQRRRVFHELEECYGNGQYRDGYSDQIVSQKLAVAIGMVAEVRETNFGPVGPDPRIVDLRRQVEGLQARITQIEDAALAVVDQAEKKAVELRRDIASLLDRINKLEGVL